MYFPALPYVCAGFLAVEYVPSPKLHFHVVGAPVLVLVNLTFRGAFPEVGVAKKYTDDCKDQILKFVYIPICHLPFSNFFLMISLVIPT